MRKVAHSHLVLLLDVSEERPLVVDTEREDSVLIGGHELGAVYGACLGARCRLEGQTVEWRKHGELELQLIARGDLEWDPLIIRVL